MATNVDPAHDHAANVEASPVDPKYRDPESDLPQAFAEEWHDSSYVCFSSAHKLCRETCPVSRITKNESHTPTAFHANVVAMKKGEVQLAEVAEDFVHCTQCGACELRCPNTLFTGDQYQFRTQTTQVVKAVRALAVEQGIEQPGWKEWNRQTNLLKNEPVVDPDDVNQENVAKWADGLNIPIGGETVLFCDCEAAFYRTSLPRAVAKILMSAGVEFGLMQEQWCCGGPAAEMGYVDQARRFAEHNVAVWRAAGAKRILVLDPHDYITFTEDYPKYFGDDYDFEIVLVLELVAELLREGKIQLTESIDRVVTYHDSCRLNKRKGIFQAPRDIINAIPGITFRDVHHIEQWSFCSGGGGGLPIERPEITEALSRERLDNAASLEVDTLLSACVWSERPLSAAGDEQQIEVLDLMEVVAESMGLDVAA